MRWALADRPIRLSLTGILLYSVTSMVAVMASSDVTLEGRLLIAVAVTVVALTTALLLRRFVMGLPSLVLVALAVGAVRGIVLVGLIRGTGAGSPLEPLRIISSTVSALVWIVAISIVLSGVDRYRVQVSAAVRQIACAQAADGLDALPEIAVMKTAVGNAATGVGTEPDAAALRAAATVLRDEIEERIRPLSHRIWFTAGSPVPRARIGPLVWDAMLTFPAPITPVLVIWMLSGLIGAPVLFGPLQGTVSVLVCTLVLAAMLLLARSLLRRWPHRFLGPVLLLASSVLPVLVTHLLLDPWAEPASALATFVLVPLALGALLLAAASSALAGADRDQILHMALARALASSEAAPSSREVSAYLHNSLQSELSALALQLDRAEPGSHDARRAVEQLAALASRSIADDFRSQQQSPIDRMHEGARAWEGIAHVKVHVASTLEPADNRLPLAVQVIEELTSNAVRHGSARTIDVSVEPRGEGLLVEMRSDGTPPVQDGAAASAGGSSGMGAGWLAAVSRGPITVSTEGSEAVVRIRL